METVLIEFTKEQQNAILPLLEAMKSGEATFAQVYIDGMRVRSFDVETVKRIQKAIGKVDESAGYHRFAVEAQESGMTPNEGLGAGAEAGRVAHWLCGSVPFHSCGNCTRGFHSGPVGIRMLCWEGHHNPTFLMPTDGSACSDFRPATAPNSI